MNTQRPKLQTLKTAIHKIIGLPSETLEEIGITSEEYDHLQKLTEWIEAYEDC